MKSLVINAVLVSIFIVSCSTVPITGRKQLSLIPGSTMLSMSFQQYDDFLHSNTLSTNQQQTAVVKRVGSNIQKAVEQYFAQKGMSDQLSGYQWETNLVESKEVSSQPS